MAKITGDISVLAKKIANDMNVREIPLKFCVETLQNAYDAGATKTLVEINYQLDGRDSVVITVSDNGNGMDKNDIATKFLNFGGVGKSTGIGGFGIGVKTVILRKEVQTWWLESKGWQFDNIAEEQDKDIMEVDVEDKTYTTKISAIITTNNIYGGMDELYNTKLKYVLSLYPGLELRINGVVTTPEQLVMSKYIENENYSIYKVDNKAYLFYLVNGSFQYYDQYNSPSMYGLLFDMKTTARPGEIDYPLDMNRGSLKDNIEWVMKMQQTLSDIKESERIVAYNIRNQEKISARGGRKGFVGERKYNGKFSSDRSYISGGLVDRYTSLHPDISGVPTTPTPEKRTIVWDELYVKSPKTKLHIKYAKLFAKVMECIEDYGLEFTVGLSGDDGSVAASTQEYIEVDGKEFSGWTYYIHPETLIEKKEKYSWNAFLDYVFTIACHEYTHRRFSRHNEDFLVEFEANMESRRENFLQNKSLFKDMV